jgi:uncharacterized membrane protein
MEIFLGLLVLAGIAVVTLVLPIVSAARVARLAHDLQGLRTRIAALEEELRTAHVRPRPSPPEPAASPTAPPRADAAAAPRADTTALPPLTAEPLQPAEPPRAPVSGIPAEGPVAAPPLAVPDAIPPAVHPTAEAASPGAPARDERTAGAIEEAIGGRLLLYAGVVAFVLGIGFFVKYAFDQQWITEGMRVALGTLCGVLFIAGGLRLARSGYETYGNILVGGGVAALYLAAYAAFDFYRLIGPTTASTLFILITVAAALLADRQRHQGLAVMAVGGGFLTPFLVGGPADAQITLFSYVALLVVGTTVLARRHEWPLLYMISYGLTVLTVLAWAGVHYRPSKYLRTELFLTLYCVMFLAILHVMRRTRSSLNDLAQVVLASAPVVYHFASIAILRRHDVALPVYLILFALAGVVWSVRAARPWLRLTVWVAVMIPFLGWADVHQSARWIVPSMATLGAIFALPLMGQIDRALRRGLRLGGTDLFLLHVNAIGSFLAAWAVLEHVAVAWVPRVGLFLALVHAGAARALQPRDRHAALHALAAMFAIVAATIGAELEGRWLTAAWAAEGAAVTWIGLRAGRDWLRFGGGVLLTVAAARWLILSALETPADFSLVFNESFAVGGGIIVLAYVLAWQHARAGARGGADRGTAMAGLLVGASVLTVALLSTQNASYWQVRSATMADATFAAQLALSLLWAFYAGILIAVGIRRSYAPIRLAGIVLPALTVLKVFLGDLSGLEGSYRVLGLVVVGAVLRVVSCVYQV